MRRFVIAGHKAMADASFKLDDLAGSAGRVDILCRCVNSAFMQSHEIRRDVEAYLVFEGGEDAPKTVRIDGRTVRYLNPDERSTGSLIRNALLKKVGPGEVQSSPGVFVSRKSFADVINELAEKGTIVYLKEDGTDIRELEFPRDPVYVLGDNSDLTPEEEALVVSKTPLKICVGPVSLHADHCMILVQNEMDRREAQRCRSPPSRRSRSTGTAASAGGRSSARGGTARRSARSRTAPRPNVSSGATPSLWCFSGRSS